MNKFETLLSSLSKNAIPILDAAINFSAYTTLDLSADNIELAAYAITDPESCQRYITTILNKNNAQVAYGGYLERRDLYADKSNFSGNTNAIRNIHLGIDYWARAHTAVLAPLNGTVHSFKNNTAIGDYGPTILLSHNYNETIFYTLYGHLSLNSIQDLYIGKEFIQGDALGFLGTPDINVNYAPHLHFQIIKEIGSYSGDYPGVCAESNLDFYIKNCPNPNLLLGL